MLLRVFLATLSVVYIVAQGPVVTEIHTLTSTNPMDEGFGQIGVTLTYNTTSCSIPNLDEDGDTFLMNALDAFYGIQIAPCNNFPVPNSTIMSVVIQHHGIDDLMLDWIRVVFSDHTFVQCSTANMLLQGEASIGPLTGCL